MTGKYIVFDGIDGGGKSLQLEMLHQHLYPKENVFKTQEPNFLSPTELVIRQKLKLGLNSLTQEQFDLQMIHLFFANRIDHFYGVGNIANRIDHGYHILSDRGTLSTVAYNGNSEENLDLIYQLAKGFPQPDYTFYFDLPVEVAMERLRQRGGGDSFEKEENLRRVQANYAAAIARMIDEGKAVFIIDANKPVEEVHKSIITLMKRIVLRS